MTEEINSNFSWWYLMIPLILGGPLFFTPAAFIIASIVITSFLVVIPLTICRIAWKVLIWAWSR